MFTVQTVPQTYSSICVNQTWFYYILGVRSSHRPDHSSTTEENPLDSSPTSTFISAMATGSSGRPPRSPAGSSRWPAEISTSSSGTYRTLGTIQSLSASSGKETYGVHGSREITDFTEQVADPSLPHSNSASEDPFPGELKLEVKYNFSCK